MNLDLTPDFNIAVSSCRDDCGRIVRNVHAEDRELVAVEKLERKNKKFLTNYMVHVIGSRN